MNTTVLLFAARRPLAITVLIVAVVAGLCIAIWLLPLGLLAYVLMVFIDMRDPALAAAAHRPPPTPRPRLTSPTFRAQIESIERTQQEIARSAAQSGGPLARLLLPIADQGRELVEEAYILADKGQIIERYLASVDRRKLEQDLAAIDQQMYATQDPYTRSQLEETRQARLEKLQNVRDLDTYIGRISAQLQNIGASLDNVLAETVRLRTADAASADSTTSQVARRLADLKSDMDAFQAVLDTALARSGAV
ncbi:hypothetical protein [Roseiflexus sp.]|uniref:hypothetical protein n=1 Tax=Roseiflexus sp. TaxID=2562120 RepID=UPI00398ABEF4